MRKPGIVFKMTITTFVFFMLFIGGALFYEGTFFESFYLERKIDSINQRLEDFSSDYLKEDWNSRELSENITLFNNENGVELTILDPYGNIQNEPLYQIIVETQSGGVYRLHLNHILNENSTRLLTLKYGESLKAYGFRWSETSEIFKPLYLSYKDEVIFDHKEDKRDLDYIEGVIIGKVIPSFDDLKSAFYKQPIREIVLEFMVGHGKKYEQLSVSGVYEKNNAEDLYGSTVFYKPIARNGSRELIFVLDSKRYIIEAREVLSDYHIYIMAFSFILIIMLSYFYSSSILKPLLIMNRIAEKMAKLDFSEKVVFKRKDELGNLSNSLNTLSANLSYNMQELQNTNKQLKIEIEKERRLENLRKEFVSGVSHELKTPLGIIRGYAEGIKDDIFEDATYYLDVIIEETEKMDALVVDMLELSKLESINFRVKKDYFDMYQLVDFVINKFHYNLREKNLNVIFERKAFDSKCYGDEVRIEQVIVNYMSNAIRHSHRNKDITIIVSENKERLRFTIENIGKHIPEDKIDRVWNRFYRVDEARNKSDGGTGLGLSIVRNIIELHGSDFGVKNTEDGVEFYFTINKKE